MEANTRKWAMIGKERGKRGGKEEKQVIHKMKLDQMDETKPLEKHR